MRDIECSQINTERDKELLMKQGKQWIAAGVLLSVIAGQALALVRDSTSSTNTIRGELVAWHYVEHPGDHGLDTDAEVTLNDIVILQEKKVLEILIEWERPLPKHAPAERVLLAINQPYPRLCESLYRLVDLTKSKSPYVTARFGNCHAEPIIHEKGDELTFYFAPFNDKQEEAYRYTPKAGLKKVPATAAMRSPSKQ